MDVDKDRIGRCGNRLRARLALFLGMGMAFLLPASAQQAVDALSADTAVSSNIRASQFIGLRVVDGGHAERGRVHDLLFDWAAGRLQQVVIAVGDKDKGEVFLHYPAYCFQIGRWEDQLLFSEKENGVNCTPGDEDALASARGRNSRAGGNELGPQRNGPLSIASLLGAPVVNEQSVTTGKLNDLVVSIPDGRMRYLAMDPVSGLNMTGRLVIVPPHAVQPEPMPTEARDSISTRTSAEPAQAAVASMRLVLAPGVAEKHFAQARTVNKNQWPKVNGAHIKEELNSYVVTSSWPSFSTNPVSSR